MREKDWTNLAFSAAVHDRDQDKRDQIEKKLFGHLGGSEKWASLAVIMMACATVNRRHINALLHVSAR